MLFSPARGFQPRKENLCQSEIFCRDTLVNVSCVPYQKEMLNLSPQVHKEIAMETFVDIVVDCCKLTRARCCDPPLTLTPQYSDVLRRQLSMLHLTLYQLIH